MTFFGTLTKTALKLFGEEKNGEEKEEYEFSADPELDAESKKILSQLRMLNAQISSTPDEGMTVAQYNDMLRREGSGR